jgi:predicted nucleic acid-binding protein
MIFIDSNIPMYLIGAPHPNKTTAQHILETCISNQVRLITDVEVFQEILHRYDAIHRREAIQPAFDVLSGIVDEIFPIEQQDLLLAKDIMLGHERLSARDAIHIAVMAHHSISKIFSFDTGFDQYPGIHRIFDQLAI